MFHLIYFSQLTLNISHEKVQDYEPLTTVAGSTLVTFWTEKRNGKRTERAGRGLKKRLEEVGRSQRKTLRLARIGRFDDAPGSRSRTRYVMQKPRTQLSHERSRVQGVSTIGTRKPRLCREVHVYDQIRRASQAQDWPRTPTGKSF